MKIIDGAEGEGGGQVFRSSLSLAMCTGQAINVVNIRAKRKKPGLLRQHLTCLQAAQRICNATVTGDAIGSTSVTFAPGKLQAGDYHFAVGSAGSTVLVFQTLLPGLLLAGGESTVLLEGGTHNGMAPSFDFMEKCFIPALATMGCTIKTNFFQYGFYPAGGGKWQAQIRPWTQRAALQLTERGALQSRLAQATSSKIASTIGERELAQVRKYLGWHEAELNNLQVQSHGPGNIVSLQLKHQHVTEVFECVGERALSAERVAKKAIHALQRYQESSAVVGEHLADQLLVIMSLGKGGQFICTAPSQHTLTNINVIEQLLGRCISVTQDDKKHHLLTVKEFVT